MRNLNKKSRIFAIALVSTLTATLLIACLPVGVAQEDNWYVFPIKTTAFMSLSPNPIGVNQLGLINAWISPRPMWAFTYYYNYVFTFTKPNGQIDTITIPISEQTGSIWFNYVPDVVGNWTVQFTWDGSDTPSGPSGNHTSATTPKQVWVVQQQPIASWPAAPLPTGPLNFPITPENREWYKLIGPWWQAEYDSSHASSNMFTQAPSTSHILWKIPQIDSLSGMIGGPYGPGTYYSGSAFGGKVAGIAHVETVMGGRGYFSTGGFIYCIDARTGKTLWSAPGSGGGSSHGVSNLQAAVEIEPAYIGVTTTLVLRSIGDRLIKYDPWTGAIICNVTGVGPPIALIGDYAVTDVGFGPGRRLIKWNLLGTADDLSSRIIWDVPYPLKNDMGIVWAAEGDVAGGFTSDFGGDSGCINLTTGATLWIKNITDIEIDMGVSMGYGKLFVPIIGQMMSARNVTTGDIVWTSDPLPYPWGEFWAYTSCLAYGNVYGCNYAGLYCFNATTGEIRWSYSSGNSMPYGETPQGTWPFFHGPLAADGKIYAGTGELGELVRIVHRGHNLHCVDAFTGDPIWKIVGIWEPTAIAEGTLFAINRFDGGSYAFSRGPTLTEVSVLQNVIAEGESAFITGRVTDQSPAQLGTPCISSEYMSEWMEYLHMQQPMPYEATGVPVHLYAEMDGTTYDIGSVVTTCDGHFDYKWTPPSEGAYQIYATFDGDDSYYSSYNITSLGVGPAPPAEPEPTQPAVKGDIDQAIEGLNPLFYGIIVAVAIAIVIGIVNLWALRKRQ